MDSFVVVLGFLSVILLKKGCLYWRKRAAYIVIALINFNRLYHILLRTNRGKLFPLSLCARLKQGRKAFFPFGRIERKDDLIFLPWELILQN